MPRRRTSTTDIRLTNTECSNEGPALPLNTCENCVSVGWKAIRGGFVYASPSRLNEVSTIQKTGKNRTRAASQVNVVQNVPTTRRRVSQRRRRVAIEAVAMSAHRLGSLEQRRKQPERHGGDDLRPDHHDHPRGGGL